MRTKVLRTFLGLGVLADLLFSRAPEQSQRTTCDQNILDCRIAECLTAAGDPQTISKNSPRTSIVKTVMGRLGNTGEYL